MEQNNLAPAPVRVCGEATPPLKTMPDSCAVEGCGKTRCADSLADENLTFFKINNKHREATREHWIQFCHKPPNWLPNTAASICSRHFRPEFVIPGSKRCGLLLKNGAVPTENSYDPNTNNVKRSRRTPRKGAEACDVEAKSGQQSTPPMLSSYGCEEASLACHHGSDVTIRDVQIALPFMALPVGWSTACHVGDQGRIRFYLVDLETEEPIKTLAVLGDDSMKIRVVVRGRQYTGNRFPSFVKSVEHLAVTLKSLDQAPMCSVMPVYPSANCWCPRNSLHERRSAGSVGCGDMRKVSLGIAKRGVERNYLKKPLLVYSGNPHARKRR
ncbi:uncharacterized protein LOC129595972 [Paramacrobiotus metropolitanus]|uniref:uncharacterized protein LOC129595972 n=1 Tax=Paramacrobiotus metropolitanus TaxID=2943436 RepID=UPI0024458039|nr:uncharacterized protein LOC129595972 [Paramacrobiotus metropolitanus]